jgi:hypothetical protein
MGFQSGNNMRGTRYLHLRRSIHAPRYHDAFLNGRGGAKRMLDISKAEQPQTLIE